MMVLMLVVVMMTISITIYIYKMLRDVSLQGSAVSGLQE
jgi:hypothetical protein